VAQARAGLGPARGKAKELSRGGDPRGNGAARQVAASWANGL